MTQVIPAELYDDLTGAADQIEQLVIDLATQVNAMTTARAALAQEAYAAGGILAKRDFDAVLDDSRIYQGVAQWLFVHGLAGVIDAGSVMRRSDESPTLFAQLSTRFASGATYETNRNPEQGF